MLARSVRRSCMLLYTCCALAAQGPERVEPLFDGRTLQNWRGDERHWSVQDGCIVGSTTTTRATANTFLIWQGEPVADFELSWQVRLQGDNNSGVQYRARRVGDDGFAVHGYQCDIHPHAPYFGMLYEEGGRGIVAQRGQELVCGRDGGNRVLRNDQAAAIDAGQWHRMRIVARGNVVEHFVDGVRAVRVTDEAAQAPRRGVIALQLHSGTPMQVWFKDLQLVRLPTAEVAEVPATGAAGAPQWIWDGKVTADQELWLRRTFELPVQPERAWLAVSADNRSRVFVNGERLFDTSDWMRVRIKQLTGLRAGRNTIAIYASNEGGPAALALRLCWQAGAQQGEVVSDQTWRCHGDEPDGWQNVGYDDSAWRPATVLGAVGDAALPWTANVAVADFELGEAPAEQPPAPAPELQLAPTLQAERLLAVPRRFGSWVSLAADPQGRLYASDQNAGLYRIVPGRAGATTTIERIEVEIGGAQGLCWAFGSLYAVVSGSKSGLYRIADGDGDDRLDRAELLRALDGDGEHGPHAVALAPDGENLLVLCGNHVRLPQVDRSRVPTNWRDDSLRPAWDDPNGHARGVPAPGGYLCLVDRDGRNWELLCAGFRNTYDLAVLDNGDVVTFDADMEWDMGLPWYRPTRILLCCSGADYGWRNGSRKWATDLPDSLPAAVDIGPSSPTGMVNWNGAVLALDWTFGTVYQVMLEPNGAGYRGSAMGRIGGVPLPLTDAVATADGLYVLTGGRGLPSKLYRITGSLPPSVSAPTAAAQERRAERQLLEGYHGRVADDAVPVAGALLGSDDMHVRHAARIAFESQPVAQWRQLALAEHSGWRGLTGLLALARQGGPDDLVPLLQRWDAFDFAALERGQRAAWLRIGELALLRLGRPDDALRGRLCTRLEALLPTGDAGLDAQLVLLLATLDSTQVVERTLPLLNAPAADVAPPWADVAARNASYGGAIAAMLRELPPTAQLGIAHALLPMRRGWTLAQRRQFLEFLVAARGRKGGASYDGYLKEMIGHFLAGCSEAERGELGALAGRALAAAPRFRSTPPRGPGRNWQLDDAAAEVKVLTGRDHAAGRNLFHATSCAACHRFAGEGGSSGPDLTSLGNKFSARDVLEAMIEPSKVISDQYGGSVVTRKDGSTVAGRVSTMHLDGVDYYEIMPAVADPKPVRVPVADVARIEASKLSPMPAGLLAPLNADELRDLIAFLLSRGDEQGPMFHR